MLHQYILDINSELIDQSIAAAVSLPTVAMGSWFNVTKDEYLLFAQDERERSPIAVRSFQPRSQFCESKLKILDEIAYQILEFGAATNLQYASVCCLFNALSADLRAMSDLSLETAACTPPERFKTVVRAVLHCW